jgi:hypothetical protein
VVVGDPISRDAVRWIVNDDTAAEFFGTPFGDVRRNPGVRGETINTINFGLFKTTNITENLRLRFEANVFNLLNKQFRGVPDPFIDSGNIHTFGDPNWSGSFANTQFNPNGGDYVNEDDSGIGRRRIELGAKITF